MPHRYHEPFFRQHHLPVIELGTDEFQPPPRDAVGPAALRGDGAFALQLADEAQAEARIAPAIAGEAMQVFRLVVFVADDFDTPALCEQVDYSSGNSGTPTAWKPASTWMTSPAMEWPSSDRR